MKRTHLYGIIALIPLVLTWVFIISIDPKRIVPVVPANSPKWIEISTYGTCSDAMSGTPITNQTPIVDEKRAANLGAGVIQSQTNLLTLSEKNVVAFTPLLVERQFPDNQSHLAWVLGQGRMTDESSMSAAAEVVYIDATTGDPLLLIKDIHAGDPVFTCAELLGMGDSQLVKSSLQIVLYLGGLLVSAAYVLAVIMALDSYSNRQLVSVTTVLGNA